MGNEKRSDDLVKKLPFFILTLSALVLVTLVVFWNNEAQRIRLAPGADLLINYPLDSLDASGQTPDIVKGSNATTQGASLTEGVTEHAVYVRGGTIDTGLDVDLAGDFTINLWVKPTTTNGRQKLVAKEFFGVMNSSYSLFLHNGFLRFEFFNTSQSTSYVSVASSNTIPANEWTMVTVTLGQDLSLYINSKLEGVISGVASRPFNRDISLLIGSTRNGTSLSSPTYIDNFDGSIDDVRIYDRAISEDESTALYQQGQSDLIRAYYTFNSISASQVLDSSSYGLTGSLVGNPSSGKGIKGTNALVFDGQGDYVTVPHAGSLDLMGGTFTLAGWVKTQSNSPLIIFEKNGAGTSASRNYGLYLNATGSFHFFAKCSAAQDVGTTQSVNDGNWHYLVAVRDGQADKRYLYIDGALVLTTDDTQCDDFSSSAPLYIGARLADSPTNNFFFNGSMENVAIYTRMLGASEVRTVYQEYLAYSPLRMSYGFNGLSNNQLVDDSDYQLSNVVNGNPTLVNGKEGSNALLLDGNDYVHVTSNQAFNLTRSYSIVSLIKTSAQTTQIILEKNDAGSNPNGQNYGLYLNATGSFHFFAKCSAAQDVGTTQSVNDGNWHYLVAVRDGQADKRYLYIDGALVLTTDDTQCDDFFPQSPLYLGARFSGSPTNNFFFNGAMDRTEIYSRVLTPTEINDEYRDIFDISSSNNPSNPNRGGSGGSSSGGGSINIVPVGTNQSTTIPIEPTIYQPDTTGEVPSSEYTASESSSNSIWFYIIVGLLGLLILASLIGLGVLVLRPRKNSSSSNTSTSTQSPTGPSMPRPPFPPAQSQRPMPTIQQRPMTPLAQQARQPQPTLSIQPNQGQRPR